MKTASRVAVNTIASYGRTVFAMALGLFSGRWVLQALGPVDYGLVGVVGSAIVFITFLNGITSNSVARFLALSIGKGDPRETSRWFNAALSIHTILPGVLILIGWPIGEWAIEHFFNIPPDRLWTARWVFRMSLASSFFGMTTTPFMAMFVAKQHILETSLWSIVNSTIHFCFIFLLTKYKGDAWLLYSGGTVFIAILTGLCQVLRARVLFAECRLHFAYWWTASHVRPLFVYAGWQLFGGVASILRRQGCTILLNKYFNPVAFPHVNASYTVGTHVAGYTQTLSAALQSALTPEIMASEGRGERARMLEHANRASKFSVYLVTLFAIPVLFEIDFLLLKWLKTPPLLAGSFCSLLLASLIIEKATFGHMLAVNATGDIAGYQLIVGGTHLLTFPLAWLLLARGYSPLSVSWAAVAIMCVASIGRIAWARTKVGLSPAGWARGVLVPCLVTFGLCAAVAALVQRHMPEPSWNRLLLVGAGSLATWSACGWLVVLTLQERRFVTGVMQRLRRRPCPR